MPGVLRLGPSGTPSVAPTSNAASASNTQSKGKVPPTTSKGVSTVPVAGSFVADSSENLPEKVARLEKHLEALYQLPDNDQLIQTAKGIKGAEGGSQMSVNDMWQIIQLNNRIAAAEAAIQKMASLIEDLAKSMGKVKADTKILKTTGDELTQSSSLLTVQGANVVEKCDACADIVAGIKKEMEHLKHVVRK